MDVSGIYAVRSHLHVHLRREILHVQARTDSRFEFELLGKGRNRLSFRNRERHVLHGSRAVRRDVPVGDGERDSHDEGEPYQTKTQEDFRGGVWSKLEIFLLR